MLWRLGLAFTFGALIAALTPALPGLWAVAPLAAVLIPAFKWPAWRWPAAFALGAAWFLLHAHWQMAQQWPEGRADEVVRVSGVITGLPEHRGQSVRFWLRPAGEHTVRLPSRIEARWFRPSEYLQPGQIREFDLRLQPPHGRLNPGGPDRYRHLLSQRIGASATVVEHVRLVEEGRNRGQVDRLRQYLAERLQGETLRLETAALFRALGLADRSAMHPELSALLRQTGTAHLLAISGLHVGMVAGMFGLLGGLLLSPIGAWIAGLDRRRTAVLCGLLAAAAYAALAGWTLPTIRALIMLTVAGLALSIRRGIRPAHALLLALLAVILLDPLSVLAVGFWMSFGAVAVLIWAFAWRPGRPVGGWLGALLVAQLVLAVGLLPLNVGVFQQLIPAALPSNLFAIPLVGFWILPLLLLALVLMMLGLPAAPVLGLAGLGVDALLSGLNWIDGLAWSYQRVVAGGLPAMIVAALGALWLIAPPGWPARWLGLLLLLPLLFPQTPVLSADTLRLTLFDVGDGQAVLLESGGQRLLYDTGPGDGEGSDLLKRLLAGQGLNTGEQALDGLIVARDHRGHAGGLETALALAPAERTRFVPGLEGTPCLAGEFWTLGAYEVRFLHPSPGLPPLGDNSACVVRVAGPGGAVLFSGGVDGQVERRLLRESSDLSADILVLGAGGHRRGGETDFLAAVQPQWALASVRHFDRFDRPHAELKARLTEAQARLVSTAACGAVTVELSPDGGVSLSTEMGQRHRFWLPRRACP